jgi:23S rRNA G2445 N2-methylase RlmL
MSKPNTNLKSLIPPRMTSRTATTVTVPVPENQPAQIRRQLSRVKTIMIAGHFDADVSFAVHELCGKLTRQKGQRVTVQQALAKSLADWFIKNGATPPEGFFTSSGR